MTKYQEYLERKRAEYGKKFDTSDLSPEFAVYYRGPRIKVRMSYGEDKFGRVGVTTGWKPSFLLLRNTRSYSGSDLLGFKDHVIAIQSENGKYIPVSR